MASIQEIRELVENYIAGDILVSDLRDGFMSHLKPASVSQDEKLKSFAFGVHALISNYFHGLFSEQDLYYQLAPFSKLGKGEFGIVSAAAAGIPSELHLHPAAFALDEAGELIPVGNSS